MSETPLAKARVGNAIRSLWLAYRELSDSLEPGEWSDEDMELWGLVTKHEAVQERLRETL